jgi:hypothetical protein
MRAWQSFSVLVEPLRNIGARFTGSRSFYRLKHPALFPETELRKIGQMSAFLVKSKAAVPKLEFWTASDNILFFYDQCYIKGPACCDSDLYGLILVIS